jgi:hypothetical protein
MHIQDCVYGSKHMHIEKIEKKNFFSKLIKIVVEKEISKNKTNLALL